MSLTETAVMIANASLLRLTARLLLAVVSLSFGSARADSPPDLPLPPCAGPNGEVGACPDTHEDISAVISGAITAGGSAAFTIDPQIPVCDHHTGYPPYPWTPSGCYSAVHRPDDIQCGYIDLQNDNVWRESSCAGILYRDPFSAPYPLFTVSATEGSAGCGGAGNYSTYVYGGPANDESKKWVNRGPTLLGCTITLNGPRPNNLRGPTWLKVRYGIDRADDGDNRHGDAEYAEAYVRIDGDLREDAVDIDVLASNRLRTEGDAKIVTYTVTLTNKGELAAENVRIYASFPPSSALGQDVSGGPIRSAPDQLHLMEFSDSHCRPNPIQNFFGGSFQCDGLSVAASGDALGNDVKFIDVVARITNVADLPPLIFTAVAPGDIDENNNEDSTSVYKGLNSGSLAQTRQAMEVLDPYFNYQTDLRSAGCNNYRDDIYARFEQIRRDHPEVFDNLSYGPITSGDYTTEVGSKAGHVGLVVYPKGTDYHETGIVIHGTPSVSPLGFYADSYDTQVGTFAMGEQPMVTRLRGTSSHGYYYRTPVVQFPGAARPEGPGCGFEGLYADNAGDFARPRAGSCVRPGDVTSEPSDPNAVVIRTESPVDLHITNLDGQRVDTEGGQITVQELGRTINSMALPHGDGTFAWTLVLPKADYTLDLIGTGDGPYRLTVTHFGLDGEPIEAVHESTTSNGQVDHFDLTYTLFGGGFEGD